MMYTPPERRRSGYGSAVTLAVSRAVLAPPEAGGASAITEVVMITEGKKPDRVAARLGYELVGERVVLRFGPLTGPTPRFPTGPVPRLRG